MKPNYSHEVRTQARPHGIVARVDVYYNFPHRRTYVGGGWIHGPSSLIEIHARAERLTDDIIYKGQTGEWRGRA